MRIIAGELKGRRLKSLPGYSVRPTSDKVKEAVFSMIAQYIPGSTVLDLFAGTGSLGLEAISRGASKAYFADRDRAGIAVLKENVKACGVEDRAVILTYDYIAALSRVNDSVDVVFLDPPYAAGVMKDCIELIGRSGIVNDGGIIEAEHSSGENLPEEIAGFIRIREKKYGRTGVTLFRRDSYL